MRKSIAVAAMLALLASGAAAQPGGGKGQGQGKGQSQAGKPAGGPARAEGPGRSAAKADRQAPRGGGNASPQRGPGAKPEKAQMRSPVARENRGNEQSRERKQDARRDVVRERDERVRERVREDVRVAVPDWLERPRPARVRDRVRVLEHRVAARRWGDGCPPGLAKKMNGCMPPGLARARYQRFFHRPDWWGYSSLPRGRYFYDDGYLLRLGPDYRINGFVPLLGGALSLGSRWPAFYDPLPLSPYHVDYFGLGPPNTFRYANNVIYRVDPETAAITSIAGLLTGDPFRVGQPLPLGYSVYNVPFAYRDRYYDRPDALYRYADGYIYQVDPTTMLIASAISLAA